MRTRVTAAALLVGLLTAAPASAVDVTVGPSSLDTTPGGTFQTCGIDTCSRTLVNTALTAPGDNVRVPADGAIVSWRVVGESSIGSLNLRVIRPDGNGQFQAAGTSSPASAFDGTSMATDLPVQFNDLVGIDAVGNNMLSLPGDSVKQVAGGTSADWSPGLADGSSQPPTHTDQPFTLQYNAVVQLDSPVVGTVSPNAGASAGGTVVTITGDHLGGATQVLFGNAPAPSFSGSNTSITATAPAAGGGTVDVRVVGPGGTSAAVPGDRYTFITPDTTAPAIAKLSISPNAFVAANVGGSIIAKVGGRVSYDLSESGTTTFTVQRARQGRRQGKKCKPPSRHAHGKPCIRYVRVRGSFSHADVAGANSFVFSGRIGGKSLKKGNYRLAAIATDAAGNKSRPVRRGFRVLR